MLNTLGQTVNRSILCLLSFGLLKMAPLWSLLFDALGYSAGSFFFIDVNRPFTLIGTVGDALSAILTLGDVMTLYVKGP